jgi:hypothetical protein
MRACMDVYMYCKRQGGRSLIVCDQGVDMVRFEAHFRQRRKRKLEYASS